jgi:hypothetical protein
LGGCEMVHIRGARAVLVMPHRTFLLPDCVGKAGPGIECPVPNLTAAKWRRRLFVTGVRL